MDKEVKEKILHEHYLRIMEYRQALAAFEKLPSEYTFNEKEKAGVALNAIRSLMNKLNFSYLEIEDYTHNQMVNKGVKK